MRRSGRRASRRRGKNVEEKRVRGRGKDFCIAADKRAHKWCSLYMRRRGGGTNMNLSNIAGISAKDNTASIIASGSLPYPTSDLPFSFSHLGDLALFLYSNSLQQRGQPDHRRRRQPTSASFTSQSLHNGPSLDLLAVSFFFFKQSALRRHDPGPGGALLHFPPFSQSSPDSALAP